MNLNIWLTPDEANLSPGRGGLVIYDKLPPDSLDLGTFGAWNNWENESNMKSYLSSEGGSSVRVGYGQNRCAMFNSALLHETDESRFKEGYENRRINLTLLFGKKPVTEGWRPSGRVEEF